MSQTKVLVDKRLEYEVVSTTNLLANPLLTCQKKLLSYSCTAFMLLTAGSTSPLLTTLLLSDTLNVFL